MSRVMVTITAYNSENYTKRIALVSNEQVHTADVRVPDIGLNETASIGKVGVVIDPKLFPEMDRFVVSVELLK